MSWWPSLTDGLCHDLRTNNEKLASKETELDNHLIFFPKDSYFYCEAIVAFHQMAECSSRRIAPLLEGVTAEVLVILAGTVCLWHRVDFAQSAVLCQAGYCHQFVWKRSEAGQLHAFNDAPINVLDDNVFKAIYLNEKKAGLVFEILNKSGELMQCYKNCSANI